MMIRFSPPSEFQPVRPERNVSTSFQPIPSSPRLERGEVAQTLLDIATLLFGALFFAVFLGGVGWSVSLLLRVAFK